VLVISIFLLFSPADWIIDFLEEIGDSLLQPSFYWGNIEGVDKTP
jgi:hypothetical protein